MSNSNELTFLYDKDAELYAVMISPELWERAQKDIMQHVSAEHQMGEESVPEVCEPIEDWECLLTYWDFQYPPTAEVRCEECGAHTEDWTKDDPRKFTLRAANLGGLVRFRCNNCSANIIKRHFKDHITCDCSPAKDSC